MEAETQIQGRILHQYFMDKTAARYIFKNGKVAEFFGGVYHTEIKNEIEELNAEIAAGIGAIKQIAGQETINSLELDPVAVFKRKIIAEYEAGKLHSMNTGDSVSDSGSFKAAGTGSGGGANAVVGAARTVPVGSINIKK